MIRPLLLFCAFGSTTTAQELSLAQPIDCTLGDSCYIQQFVDHDAGPGATDFSCGSLSYDGHKGTDFALPTLADQEENIAVLAAAPGIVTATRNDMPDILQGTANAPDIEGRECGNGLVIDHGSGWETQYCHLAQGSVTVQSGDKVAAGDPLGMVGLSGQTEFPHLHLAVRHNGIVIDPFAPDRSTNCTITPQDTLWTTPPETPAGGLIGAGLTGAVPDYAQITAGETLPSLHTNAPLIGWGYYFGSQEGDTLTFSISGPAGEMHSSSHDLPQRALGFQFSGRQVPTDGWPAGTYTLTTTHLRNGQPLSQSTTTATMR